MASAPILDRAPVNQNFERWSEPSFNVASHNPRQLTAVSMPPTQDYFHASIARQQVSRDVMVPVIDGGQRQSSGSLVMPLDDSQDRSNVLEVPRLFVQRKIENRSVNTLQEWEGLVDDVDGEYFTARLRDLTSRRTIDEIAKIPLNEVDPGERDRVVPGAVFHLFIGYTKRGGSQRRETFTYFRKHLPSNSATAELADLLSSFDD